MKAIQALTHDGQTFRHVYKKYCTCESRKKVWRQQLRCIEKSIFKTICFSSYNDVVGSYHRFNVLITKIDFLYDYLYLINFTGLFDILQTPSYIVLRLQKTRHIFNKNNVMDNR